MEADRPPHCADVRALEADKRQAIEQLAAGVAHEVRNPLMVLLTGVRVLQQRGSAGEADLATLLEDMEQAVKRADWVITQLWNFAERAPLAVAVTDLNDVIAGAGAAVQPTLAPRGVTLALGLAPRLPAIALDALRLQQALVQVLANAGDATPRGGTITVRTHVRRQRIAVEVDDAGPGLSDTALRRAFDPFFTTKPPGAGTGMGLALARQVVEMHGATITIANRKGGGARVTITFPLTPRRGA